MTTNRGRVFAVVFAVLLAVSMGALGVQGSVVSQSDADGAGPAAVQTSADGLNLTASGSNVIVPDHNVTTTFTLANDGDEPAASPAIELVSVPGEWEVVDQSAGENVTYSESERAWISTESLAPGESMTVEATFRLAADEAPTEYYVSARASDAGGGSDTTVVTFPVDRAEANLTLETGVADTVAQGENVTMDVTLRNDGEADSTAPAVGVVVPAGWAIVDQSSGENVNFSEGNAEWLSTEPLAPGESTTVSAVVRPADDVKPGEYYVSVRGYDADGESAVSAAAITVTEAADETATETTASEETTAAVSEETTAAETTTDAQAEGEATETTEAETTAAEAAAQPQTITETVDATFLVDGEAVANVTLEVADSPDERATGLMHRESLPEDRGMVFVYGEADERSFWMKNTLIPLDMVFVDANGTVRNVEHADPPAPEASDDELATYASDGPAKYVIEMEQGFANETGIGPGAQVEFDVEGSLEPNQTDS
ncbi:DUF192 domain-containing protein [Halorussus marinus]|uniref:DUF192 domain-containing protein n=1 Tax=Halorussus marinus TaxID=2505976 RepID=UPI00106EC514|nr:DUF192 domain-containing protein [Halorussus marinus]